MPTKLKSADELNAFLLPQARSLVSEWVPGGKLDGDEYVVRNPTRNDQRPGSFRFNVSSGVWADFATNDKGVGLIGYYAYVKGLQFSVALKECSQKYDPQAHVKRNGKPHAKPAPLALPPPQPATDDDGWVCVPAPHWADEPYTGTELHWHYFNGDGRLMGVIVRHEATEARPHKSFSPFTWWQNPADPASGEWRNKSWPRPRPMYGLDRLAERPDANVLVVEGEKCADSAHHALPDFVCVSWPGGSKSLKAIDLSPLKGRRVWLWPDNDTPGHQAMAELADLIRGDVAQVATVMPPADVPAGWDIADAVESGWTADQLLAHIQAVRAESPPAPEAEPELPIADDATPDTPKPDFQSFDGATFRILGTNSGTFYYSADLTEEILPLRARDHVPLNLYQLADEAWWKTMFSRMDGEGNANMSWQTAACTLINRSMSLPRFNEKSVRGVGSWIDDSRVVFHAGNCLFVDGQRCRLREIKSKFFYVKSDTIEDVYDAEPLGNFDASNLIVLCESLAVKTKVHARLLAGWCVCALIGGALRWRPHMQLSGPSGSGKSWVLANLIRPILGREFSVLAQSATTEAGLRQQLKSDARPILFDEAETERRKDAERIDAILNLMRGCSQDSGFVFKGTSSGAGMSFLPRYTFCFSSIGVAATMRADASRVSVIELQDLRQQIGHAAAAKHFDDVQAMAAESTLNNAYCASFRARVRSLAGVISQNAEIFALAVARKLSDTRIGDQIGTLLAGAYSLTSTNLITPDQADAWVQAQDWSAFIDDMPTLDQSAAWTRLLAWQLRLEDITPAQNYSIGELIEMSRAEPTDETPLRGAESARQLLARNGVKVGPSTVTISDSHPTLMKVFDGTAWSGGKWKSQFRRMPGAEIVQNARFAGSNTRATEVPDKQEDAG